MHMIRVINDWACIMASSVCSNKKNKKKGTDLFLSFSRSSLSAKLNPPPDLFLNLFNKSIASG